MPYEYIAWLPRAKYIRTRFTYSDYGFVITSIIYVRGRFLMAGGIETLCRGTPRLCQGAVPHQVRAI